jgi:hypothetical protein
VMFHHEIPYRAALERGATQAAILAELTLGSVAALSEIDFERAESAISARLAPV